MKLTKEEIIKANDYLRKKGLGCSSDKSNICKKLLGKLDDDMTSEDFFKYIVPNLNYEIKHKLGVSIAQSRYRKKYPTKQVKFKKNIADEFKIAKKSKTNDEFLKELLELYSKNTSNEAL